MASTTKLPLINTKGKGGVGNVPSNSLGNIGRTGAIGQTPKVTLPQLQGAKKNSKKDRLSKQKSLSNMRALEKSMDEDTLRQLYKLIRGATAATLTGERIALPNSVPTSPSIENKICLSFHRAFAEKDYQKQSIILQQLGDIYLQRAKDSKAIDDIFTMDGTDDILRAVSAYSGALVRTLHAEQRLVLFDHIRKAQTLYVEMCYTSCKTKKDNIPDYEALIKASSLGERYIRRVEKFREFVRKRLNRIQDMWKHKFVVDQRLPSRGQEFEVMKESLNLANKVKNELKGLFKDIVHDCVEKLGPPPCKYAIVGVGDFAINFATPYSDFQYIILTKKDVIELNEYFKYLANLINIEILLLCETPLTATNLCLLREPTFKNLKTVFDNKTLHGIKVDVSVGANSINPFVFKYSSHIEESDQDVDLIKTPAQMVRFMYMLHDRGHHTFALTMYQNAIICGDNELYNEFRNMVEQCFIPKQDAALDDRALAARQYIVQLATEQYDINFFFETVCGNTNIALQHVTQDLKGFGILLYAVKLIYSLSAKMPVQIIEELKYKGLITEEGESNLKVLICVIYFLRVRSKQLMGGQTVGKELLKPQEAIDTEEERPPLNLLQRMFNMKDAGILVRVYASLYPLAKAIHQYNYQSNPTPNLRIDLRRNDPVIYFQVFYRIMDYSNALETVRSFLVTDMKLASREDQWEFYTNVGFTALKGFQTKLANALFTHAMETKDEIEDELTKAIAFVTTWHNMGLVHMREGKFEKADTYFKESLKLHREMTSGITNAKNKQPNHAASFSAMAHTSLAKLCIIQGHYQSALVHLKQVHVDLNSIENHTSPHLYNWKRWIAIEIVGVHTFLGEFKSARGIMQRLTDSDMKRNCVIAPNVIFIQDVFLMAKLLRNTSKTDSSQCLSTYAYHMAQLFIGDDKISMNKNDLEDIGIFDKLSFLRLCRDIASLAGLPSEFVKLAKLCSEISKTAKGSNLTEIDLTDDRVCRFDHAWDLIEYGKAQKASKRYEEAFKLVVEAKDIFQKVFPRRHQTLSSVLSFVEIGLCEWHLEHFEEAVNNFNTAYNGFKAILGKRMVPTQINVLEYKADVFRAMKKYDDAVKTWDDCILFRRQVLGNVHRVVAHSYRKHALLLQELMDFEMAVSSFQTSLKMYKILHGKDHRDVAHVQFELGRAYDDMFEAEKADQHLRRALDTWRYLFKGNDKHEETAEVLTYIGTFYRQQTAPEKAIEFHQVAIESCEAVYGKVSKQTANVYAQLAEDYHATEELELCTEFYETAIQLYEEASAGVYEDLNVANWMRDLGRVYQVLGMREKATQCQRRSLQIKEQFMGKEAADADLLDSLCKLAVRHEGKGDFKRAIPLRRQFLKKHKQVNDGVPSFETTNALSCISNDYLETREFEYALSYNAELIDTLKILHGTEEKHIDIANAIHFRGFIFDTMGRLHRAIKLYEQSLKIYRELDSPQGCIYKEQIATALMHLGNTLTAAGHQESEKILREAIRILRSIKLEGEKRALLSRAYFSLGEAFEVHPKWEKAVFNHERAMKLRIDMCEAPHKDVADSYRAVGHSKCKLGMFKEGISYLLTSLRMWKQLDQNAKQYGRSLLDIGQAYSDADQPNKGIEYMLQALKLFKNTYEDKKAHLQIARCYEYLAEASAKAGKLTDSISYAKQSLESYIEILNYIDDHPVFAHLNDLMGDAHMKMGQYEKAVAFYKKSAQMYLQLHNESIVTWDVQRAMAKHKNAENIYQDHKRRKAEKSSL